MSAPEPAVRAHLRHLELLGRSALTVYHRRLRLAALQAVLPVPLAEATAEQLYDWRSGLRVANATAAGYISHVKEFYAWLAAAGYRPDDPAAVLPVPATPRRLPRPIAEADLMRAVACAPPRVRLALVLAGWCGLRACEIAGLRAECIRLRGTAPHLIIASESTKGITERAVPLSVFVVRELAAADLPVTGLVFRRFDGKPLPPWMVSKLCNEHLHDLGIADTLHSLRHRFATEAYAAGSGILLLADMMGHACIENTRMYTKVSGGRAAEIVAALPVPPPAPVEHER